MDVFHLEWQERRDRFVLSSTAQHHKKITTYFSLYINTSNKHGKILLIFTRLWLTLVFAHDYPFLTS